MMIGQLNRMIVLALLSAVGGCAEAPINEGPESGAITPNEAAVTSGQTGAGAPRAIVGAGNEANAAPLVPGPNPTAPAVSAPSVASKAPAVSGPSHVVLAVEGEGVRLFNRETSAASPIAFGRPAAGVLATLERLRGPAGKGINQDCGAGPVEYATWPDGLSLVFQRDRFVGWGLDGRAADAIGTSSSIGPGSTRAQLADAYGNVRFMSSSIGQEFSVAGFFGRLSGKGDRSKITDMWAGVSCVAR